MEKKSVRTGIFGGSFNPIHIGHLALANYLCEFGHVDEVWFLISPQNPFKQDKKLLDDCLRLELARAAVAGYPRFRASDFEFSLPRPSYTVNTLHQLTAVYPEKEFHLIIGADNWEKFSLWKSPEEILRKHRILVYPRSGYSLHIPDAMSKQVKAVQTPLLEISSTFIRKSIAEGKDIRYFVHPAVYRIILEKRLYQVNNE